MGLLEILDHRLCGAAQDEPLSPGPGQAGNPSKSQNLNCCDRCDLHEECTTDLNGVNPYSETV